jgi:hypothetical protein
MLPPARARPGSKCEVSSSATVLSAVTQQNFG